MTTEIKCPVCGKTGIENYHSKDVVCPCCDSDLSVFRAIDEIADKRTWYRSLWVSIVAIVGVAAIYCCIDILYCQEKTNSLECRAAQLEDSIAALNLQMYEITQKPVPQTVIYQHIVRRGDNLWKISLQYYNTGTRYGEIAEWNNIGIHTILHVGDTIILK